MGRNEQTTMDFVRRHDEYEKKPKLHDCFAQPTDLHASLRSPERRDLRTHL